jgi:S-adenosylmethionine synthetase
VPISLAQGQKHFVFTSESVSEGHPDKVCDQISDAILDAFLAKDNQARVAIETLATTNRVVIAGEVRSREAFNPAQIEQIARDTIREIGYEQDGFHWKNAKIEVLIHGQSADIAQGVDAAENKEEGAGDQGIMFGYACNETPSYMPAPIFYAHSILEAIFDDIRTGKLAGLGPDAKSQVTLAFEDGKPVKAETVVVSIQHHPDMTQQQVRDIVRSYVTRVLPQGWMCDENRFYTNPTGQFIIGGPDGDCGLTGRKIIVDTYGGAAPHGGGCFSGKDPSKVDRSAAYMARYLAKNVVAAGLADECTIQIAYAIGVSKPLAFYVNTHGTGTCPESSIAAILQELVDLSPRGIRTHLGLNRPIYKRTASYGHFGRNPEKDGGFSWEKLDLVEALLGGLDAKKPKLAVL